MERIVIEIGSDGGVKIEVNGLKGPGCKHLTHDLEAALGRGGTSLSTEEFYDTTEQDRANIGQA